MLFRSMNKDSLKIFKNIPTLKTDRLILRKIECRDLSDVYEYTSDPLVPQYLMWYPHKTREYTKSYLQYIKKLYKKGKFYDWGIEFEGKLIGTVGFSSISVKNNSAEIGYVLNSKFWNKGIATEAVNEILKFAFSILDIQRVEAIFLPENEKSRKVLIKCGMKFEGVRRSALLVKGEYRDVEMFSIIKADCFKE